MKFTLSVCTLIALSISSSFNIVQATPLECDQGSPECCWVIRSFQLMGGSDKALSDRTEWRRQIPTVCCYMDGIECAITADGQNAQVLSV